MGVVGPSSSSRGLCVSEGMLGSVAEITETLNHSTISKHSQVCFDVTLGLYGKILACG